MPLFQICLIFLELIAATPATPLAQPADTSAIRPAIERGLKYLEKDGLRWKQERKCATCHHAPLMIWAMNESRARGFKINEDAFLEVSRWLVAEGDPAQIIPKPDDPENDYYDLAAAYLTLASEAAQPRDPEVTAGIKRFAEHIIHKQNADGSWISLDRSPPNCEGPEFATLLSRMTLSSPLLNDDDRQTTLTTALARADAWLAAPQSPPQTAMQTRNMRFLLALRGGRSPASSLELIPALTEILAKQNADGGWSQAEGIGSDAYATGQTLYVLGCAGYTQSDPVIARASRFLTDTQKEDGSWPMISRPKAPGGTGSKNLEPITYAGAAWGVLGLVRTLER